MTKKSWLIICSKCKNSTNITAVNKQEAVMYIGWIFKKDKIYCEICAKK